MTRPCLILALAMAAFAPMPSWGQSAAVTPAANDSFTSDCFRAARMVADWMVTNQVRDWGDANNGRFLQSYAPQTQDQITYSIDWMTATSVMGMLMMHHRTGEEQYREAALLGGSYLKSLQILDPRDPRYYGAFREDTPQSTWCYTRDALTAAWALLWLHEETGDPEYLFRVDIFIDWFKREAMRDGWPLWEVNYRGESYINTDLLGSFHGGNGAFFYDYWRVTGSPAHLEDGLKFIADGVCDTFLSEDGEFRVVFSKTENKFLDDTESPRFPRGWVVMHKFNDDFSTISLLDAWVVFKDEKYLRRTEAFAQWLMARQSKDGGFGAPPVASASATGPIMLLDLHKITGKAEYLEAAQRAGRHLMTLMETDPSDPRAFGGIYGMVNNEHGRRDLIYLRASSYALIAFLKLEGVEQGPYFSAGNRKGEIRPGVGTR